MIVLKSTLSKMEKALKKAFKDIYCTQEKLSREVESVLEGFEHKINEGFYDKSEIDNFIVDWKTKAVDKINKNEEKGLLNYRNIYELSNKLGGILTREKENIDRIKNIEKRIDEKIDKLIVVVSKNFKKTDDLISGIEAKLKPEKTRSKKIETKKKTKRGGKK